MTESAAPPPRRRGHPAAPAPVDVPDYVPAAELDPEPREPHATAPDASPDAAPAPALAAAAVAVSAAVGPDAEDLGEHGPRARRPRRLAAVAGERLDRRRLYRRMLIGGVCAIVALLAVSTAAGIVNRPPSTQDVAAEVAGQVPGDGALAPLTAAAEQFVRAYLTVAPGPEAEQQRRWLLNSLTGGAGAAWVASDDTSAQTVVSGPSLALPPAPSGTYPGTTNLVYQARVQAADGTISTVVLSVPTAVDDSAQGIVVAPPAWLPPLAAVAPDLQSADSDSSVVAAATPNVEQFLKAWAAAGPSAADEAMTQLEAFLAPDATMYTRLGMDGAVQLAGLSDLLLAPVAEGSADVQGTATVVWRTPAAGSFRQSYSLQLRQEAGKWLVQRIGVL